MQKIFLLLLILPLLQSCASSDSSSADPFSLYCEMVANDAKPIALSDPMSPHDLDLQWKNYETIAEHYGVQLYRESSFMVTSLWPSAFTEGKDVVIIYKYPRLKQYQQLKSDISKIRPLEGARRFGRLLGYSNQGINDLLMKNSDFRTLESFGVGQQITHLYYEDLEEAQYFYGSVLGLQKISDGVFRVSTGAVLQLHTFNKKHPKGQPKSTAIAFLTDQLPEWYRYLQEQQVPIKYTYKPKEGGPHDGFVAIDPGGYLL
ncbi:MAG: VOC family protein, partial [Ekhidna sp.]|nr:VOC family protein [Ekhidna sp.]